LENTDFGMCLHSLMRYTFPSSHSRGDAIGLLVQRFRLLKQDFSKSLYESFVKDDAVKRKKPLFDYDIVSSTEAKESDDINYRRQKSFISKQKNIEIAGKTINIAEITVSDRVANWRWYVYLRCVGEPS
jgi:hypothetical protein